MFMIKREILCLGSHQILLLFGYKSTFFGSFQVSNTFQIVKELQRQKQKACIFLIAYKN